MRRSLRAARAARDDPWIARAGISIANRSGELAGVTIAAFVGVRGEVPTLPLLERLRERAVRVILPVLLDDDDLDWATFMGTLGTGRLGMSEPDGDRLGRDAIALADLVLCPALAVDLAGHRLGQGGGSYDRALPRTTAPIVAVVFDDELLDEVPNEPHDRPVDGVFTPANGLRWLGSGRIVG